MHTYTRNTSNDKDAAAAMWMAKQIGSDITISTLHGDRYPGRTAETNQAAIEHQCEVTRPTKNDMLNNVVGKAERR